MFLGNGASIDHPMNQIESRPLSGADTVHIKTKTNTLRCTKCMLLSSNRLPFPPLQQLAYKAHYTMSVNFFHTLQNLLLVSSWHCEAVSGDHNGSCVEMVKMIIQSDLTLRRRFITPCSALGFTSIFLWSYYSRVFNIFFPFFSTTTATTIATA